MTSMRAKSTCRARARSVAIAALVTGGMVSLSCGTPPAARRLRERFPNSHFEVRLTGCVSLRDQAQGFGSNVTTALLWSRERVKNARYFPCSAVIRAIGPPEDTTAVYVISIKRDGSYEERAVTP